MGHINQEPNGYDSTVSAFIVLIQDEESKILLHRHRILGSWFQPGGHVEPSENPWQAITHELLEETGYELSDLLVLQAKDPLVGLSEISHPVPLLYRSHRYSNSEPAHFHTDATFGFVAELKPKLLPAEGESQELFWFTEEELMTLAPSEIHPDVRAIAKALLGKFQEYRQVPAKNYSLNQPEILNY